MQVYCVGGAVRDELLNLPVADRDYVVVGATPEEMVHLGFKPVGRDFPVFLHPRTRAEYALARTERKVARGYKGFTISAAPDVTLEQDLERRDLTINAMARDADGTLIDPFGGERDLREGVLRHVSPAFAEDPVRILRVARFAARFPFAVAPETLRLMQRMVADGEADALVAERIWQEFARGLMEARPQRMLQVLALSGLLGRVFSELGLAFEADRPANDAARTVLRALGWAAGERLELPVRFALLFPGLRRLADPEAALRAVAERLRAPSDCREAALTLLRHGARAKRARGLRPEELLELLQGCDAFRRPQRLDRLLWACRAEDFGERGWLDLPSVSRQRLECARAAAGGIDTEAAAAGARAGIAERIKAARLEAISRACAPFV